MATTYDILATQGNTLLLNLTANDSAGAAINLSGYSARGYVRYNYSSTGILLNLNPVVASSYIYGIVNISGNSEAIAAIPVGMYPYDLEVFNSGGYVTKFLRGYFNVSPQATY